MGGDTRCFFKASKDAWHVSLHTNLLLFHFRAFRGSVSSEKLGIKQWYHAVIPRNLWNYFKDLGVRNSCTAFIFSGSASTPSCETTCLRNFKEVPKKRTLLHVNSKICASKLGQDRLHILKMPFNGWGIDNNAIQVHKTDCNTKFSQNSFHQPLKGCRSILKSKRHNIKLK